MERSPLTRNIRRSTRPTGLHRGSCTWLDAIGPGYAVGISSTLVDRATRAVRSGYCH